MKILYFVLHKKLYLYSVQVQDMTLQSFYRDSILKSYPSENRCALRGECLRRCEQCSATV